DDSPHFGRVESQQFRFWHELTPASLGDLVSSRAEIAVMPEPEREHVLTQVQALYDDYGRGHSGMRLPCLVNCYRAVVRQPDPVIDPAGPISVTEAEEPEELDLHESQTPNRPHPEPPEDPGTLLVDFH